MMVEVTSQEEEEEEEEESQSTSVYLPVDRCGEGDLGVTSVGCSGQRGPGDGGGVTMQVQCAFTQRQNLGAIDGQLP